jgi:hypothetical protein
MKPILTLIYLFCLVSTNQAQQIADFEQFVSAVGQVRNGSDGLNTFTDAGVSLPNTYTVFPNFSAWTGWSISSVADPFTAGLANQYAARPGGAISGIAYAVGFAGGDGNVLELTPGAAGAPVEGLYVTNTSYAYYSMLDGDMFSKQFGGETGNDPDFFLLTVKGYSGGNLGADSVDFYLADYRFANNNQDYIVDDWRFVDLSGLGAVDSLAFSMQSSDFSAFGLNTPAYFAIDDVTTAGPSAVVTTAANYPEVGLFPNPARHLVRISGFEQLSGDYRLIDASGRVLRSGFLRGNELNISDLKMGVYSLLLLGDRGWTSRRLVKQ